MDRPGKGDRLPTWLYALIGLGVCAVLFVVYGWLFQKWGGLVVLVEVAILAAIVVVGIVLSLRRPRG